LKKRGPTVLIILFIAGCAAVLYWLYIPNSKTVPAFDEGTTSLVVGGDIVTSRVSPEIVDEQILLPLDLVKKYFDPNIYWDGKAKKVTITTRDKVIRMKTESLSALINNKPVSLNIPVSEKGGTVLIPIEFLSDFYNIKTTYIKENNVIVIDYKNSPIQLARPISEKAVMRNGRSIHNPIVKNMGTRGGEAGDAALRIFGEYDRWYKVRASDGTVGFIEKRFVSVSPPVVPEAPATDTSTPPWKPAKGKINLVWEFDYGEGPDVSKIKKMDGLDVVSPTWFHIADEKGNISNRADIKYVNWAHKNGYKVWALLNNDVSPATTGKFLNNTDVRDYIMRQVLSYASLYKLDGINIDFENINVGDKDALTQFVREITPLLKNQGLVVSMDVGVPDGSENYSLCYDFKALGQIVDYIMLMAYDQHWTSSPQAGSTAQITWVEQKLKKTLQSVPQQKLILGLPFYTRLWKEDTGKDGKTTVTCLKSLSMEDSKKLVEDNHVQAKWDEESGQFYAQYEKDNSIYKIWLEDENSINLKSSLVQKYGLAGAASWRRNFETPSIWEVLNKNLKGISSYQEWIAANGGKKYSYNPLN
jgi:spore germination protein YaaH